jgi:hypothetical protein
MFMVCSVAALRLRQSGTLHFSCVRFFRAKRGKTAHKRNGKYHAAAGKNVALVYRTIQLRKSF